MGEGKKLGCEGVWVGRDSWVGVGARVLSTPSVHPVTIQWTSRQWVTLNTLAQLSLVFPHTHLLSPLPPVSLWLSLWLASLSLLLSLSPHLPFPPSSGSPSLWPIMFV